jgi:hypothetical protein
MRALVVYESMYGNTRRVAEAVRDGLADAIGPGQVTMEAVGAAIMAAPTDVDLLVVGAPTHTWSLSRAKTRQAAADAIGKPGNGLILEPGATGPGVRDWLALLGRQKVQVATFDTRLTGAALLTGRAGRRIRRELMRRGGRSIAPNESFLVSRHNQLLAGETDRARRWAREVANQLLPAPAGDRRS